MFKNFKCYIEEYTNGNSLCARLREYNASDMLSPLIEVGASRAIAPTC